MSTGEQCAPVVISPHLDDGVFSCGDLLAASEAGMVITVCTGLPDDLSRLTPWDRDCGFTTAGEAMASRLEENRQALQLLSCEGLELGLPDSQYVDDWQPYLTRLHEALRHALERLHPQQVVMPLGLFHDDHIRVSDAMLSLMGRLPTATWTVYEDVPYRAREDVVAQRLSALRDKGIVASRAPTPWCSDQKLRAVQAYQSQLKGFGRCPDDLGLPESYWRLTLCQEDI